MFHVKDSISVFGGLVTVVTPGDPFPALRERFRESTKAGQVSSVFLQNFQAGGHSHTAPVGAIG
jgi:hypothetical protein